MKTNVRRLTVCAAVAAIYTALTFWLAPISYGPIQVRLSEAMCILPFFAPYTIWGLFVGCLLANICNPGGVMLLDVIFGSLATLLAAWLTSRNPQPVAGTAAAGPGKRRGDRRGSGPIPYLLKRFGRLLLFSAAK